MADWISVEDRLPEFDVSVLACRRNGSTQQFNYEACTLYESDIEDGGSFWLYSSDAEIAENVLYWQPLPSPPKAGE